MEISITNKEELIWESHLRSKESMLIILTNQHNETKEVNLESMMPFPWPAQ